MNIEPLAWDSQFFGFPVAKVTGAVNAGDTEVLFRKLHAANVQLAYYSASQPVHFAESALYKAELVDKKITYAKAIEQRSTAAAITTYTGPEVTPQLLQLAIRSGLYSRFKVDANMPPGKFEALYTQWMMGCVSKKMADEVLVWREDGIVVGFVSIGHKNNRADIGLIAVAENFAGKGIGKALMMAAESFAAGKYDSIQVVTQQDNKAACALYERAGYVPERKEFFYHLWQKENKQLLK